MEEELIYSIIEKFREICGQKIQERNPLHKQMISIENNGIIKRIKPWTI